MTDEDKQIINFGLQKDFWKKVNWIHYTTKYNERLLAFEEGGNAWNFPVVDFSKGALLVEKQTLAEWKETDPFYQNLMERITLCLNYCKDKTNEELKR